MSIVCPTCPLDFHRLPSVNSVPLSPLHKGTIVSVPSPLFVWGVARDLSLRCAWNYQRRSLTIFCLCPGIHSRSHPLQHPCLRVRTLHLCLCQDVLHTPPLLLSVISTFAWGQLAPYAWWSVGMIQLIVRWQQAWGCGHCWVRRPWFLQ